MSRKANFVRVDELYDDNRKIKRAWRRSHAAVGVHVMAITHSKRHQTDGVVDEDWLEDLLPKAREREAVVRALVESGLFKPIAGGGYRIHDWLEWQVGRVEREQRSEQARAAAHARWHADTDTTLDTGGDAGRMPDAMRSACGSHQISNAETEAETETEVFTSTDVDVVEPSRLDEAKHVVEVVDYWRGRCGHEKAKATRDRQAKVRARLREGYTVEQIKQAVDGAAAGAFVNDQGVRFDDLELICRSGSKLEGFMRRAGEQRSVSGHIRLRPPDPADGLDDRRIA